MDHLKSPPGLTTNGHVPVRRQFDDDRYVALARYRAGPVVRSTQVSFSYVSPGDGGDLRHLVNERLQYIHFPQHLIRSIAGYSPSYIRQPEPALKKTSLLNSYLILTPGERGSWVRLHRSSRDANRHPEARWPAEPQSDEPKLPLDRKRINRAPRPFAVLARPPGNPYHDKTPGGGRP